MDEGSIDHYLLFGLQVLYVSDEHRLVTVDRHALFVSKELDQLDISVSVILRGLDSGALVHFYVVATQRRRPRKGHQMLNFLAIEAADQPI